MEIRDLEPKTVWNNFTKLNNVPRPSKKEERVIAFAKGFGDNLGLSTYVDGVGNVIISKPATAGMENRKTVVLQSHLDMVCQKNSDTEFDFDTQGIEMFIEIKKLDSIGCIYNMIYIRIIFKNIVKFFYIKT